MSVIFSLQDSSSTNCFSVDSANTILHSLLEITLCWNVHGSVSRHGISILLSNGACELLLHVLGNECVFVVLDQT